MRFEWAAAAAGLNLILSRVCVCFSVYLLAKVVEWVSRLAFHAHDQIVFCLAAAAAAVDERSLTDNKSVTF